MRIQCDVCERNEASVFCTADEAALCGDCDRRVHHANKLAGKHHRFFLQRPSCEEPPPLCDICKERRAFLFCQQDRAILCKDCDVSIHRANKHTRMHTRFLLVGLIVSGTGCSSYSESEALVSSRNDAIATSTSMSSAPVDGKTDGILIEETLPGWHFEDYFPLDSSFVASYGVSQGGNNPVVGADFNANLCSFPSSQETGFWVPQSARNELDQFTEHHLDLPFEATAGTKGHISRKRSRKWIEDNSCYSLVPDRPSVDCFQPPENFPLVPNREQIFPKV